MDISVPTLLLRNISKTFGGQRALDNINLSIVRGEIHALLGQNGSGKSTIIKILAGFHTPDAGGELEFNGQPVKLPIQDGDFRKIGMSFVHQDLGLIPSLSVLENLRMGEFASRVRWRVSWNEETKC